MTKPKAFDTWPAERQAEWKRGKAESDHKNYVANREKRAEWQRKYTEANRERIAKRRRKYYEANRDGIAKEKHKYYEANRQKIAEKGRKYYEANTEKIAGKKLKSNRHHRELRDAAKTLAMMHGIKQISEKTNKQHRENEQA